MTLWLRILANPCVVNTVPRCGNERWFDSEQEIIWLCFVCLLTKKLQHLTEKTHFWVSRFTNAPVRWGGKMKRLLISFFLSNKFLPKLSKSVHICQSYSKPKVERFLQHSVVQYEVHVISHIQITTWTVGGVRINPQELKSIGDSEGKKIIGRIEPLTPLADRTLENVQRLKCRNFATVSHTRHHNRCVALFLGPPGWTGARRKLLLDFMG